MATLLYLVVFCALFIVLLSGFTIRLWPLNERRTAGFVEVFHQGEWGLLGEPGYRFDDFSAASLCKRLDISVFGYGGIWTPVGSYTGFIWLTYFDCPGNGTCYIPSYKKGSTLEADADSFYYRYANSLHCVDSRLINGSTYNEGILQTTIYGHLYTVCFDGFDMNAATVICNQLGFNGAVVITAVDPDETTIYSNGFVCDGSEYSLLECNQTVAIQSCQKIVHVTCQAVRLMSTNEYKDEGAVEIFYNGTWGFVGTPDFAVSEITAKYICNKLGLGSSGFGVFSHPLDEYDRNGWYSYLSCDGNETHIMQCDMSDPYALPPVQYTYQRGSWLYCFDFIVSNVRLVDGNKYNDGWVQLEINGQWGSICTTGSSVLMTEKTINAGNILCRAMGFLYAERAFGNFRSFEMSWMFNVDCNGSEDTITDCAFQKGGYYGCYNTPLYLQLTCKDFDDCQSDPCVNNGTCIDAFNNFTCVCPSPWGGHLCEEDTVDDCLLGRCYNGATCIDRIDSYTCQCADGFDGVSCQINIDECEQRPCKNNGSCVDRINGYTCICGDGYEGVQCEDEVMEQMMLIMILASSAGFLLMITVIIICCCVHYRRKDVKTKNPGVVETNPSKQSEGIDKPPDGAENKSGGYSNVYSSISDQLTDYSTVKDTEEEDVYHTITDSRIEKIEGVKNEAHGHPSLGSEKANASMYDNSFRHETNADHNLGDSYLKPVNSDGFKATAPTRAYHEKGKGTNGNLGDSYLIPAVHVSDHSDGSKASTRHEPDERTKDNAPTDLEDYDDIAKPLSASTQSNIEYFYNYRRAKGVSTEIEMRDFTKTFSRGYGIDSRRSEDYDDIIPSPATTRDTYMRPSDN